MNHQTTKSLLAGEIDKPKGNATVNDDTNFTMSCSGANPPLEQNETLVSAWCQIFFPKLVSIPATPDTGTASQITPGATSWQHSSLDGSDVENHEGEDHTFVIWFEINSDPMMPNDFRPFSSVFKPFRPTLIAKPVAAGRSTTKASTKRKSAKVKPKKAAPKKKPSKPPKSTKKAKKTAPRKSKSVASRRAKPKVKAKRKTTAKAKKRKK